MLPHCVNAPRRRACEGHSAGRGRTLSRAARLAPPAQLTHRRFPRGCCAFARPQEALLHASFAACPTLTRERKASLAAAARLAPRQVEVWFQNRRARLKAKDAAARCATLEAQIAALRAENNAIRESAAAVAAAMEQLQRAAAIALAQAHAETMAARAAAAAAAHC